MLAAFLMLLYWVNFKRWPLAQGAQCLAIRCMYNFANKRERERMYCRLLVAVLYFCIYIEINVCDTET